MDSRLNDDQLSIETSRKPRPTQTPEPSQELPAALRRLKGASAALITVALAFLTSGLAILVIGKNPLRVYKAFWDGTGLNFFFRVGSYSIRMPLMTAHAWFWWDTSSASAQNLQQALLLTAPLILTALAVAFPFRCGMFNIGGQGQYWVGSFFAVWIGSSFVDLNGPVHITFCIIAAMLAGAAWAGVAGILKALVGAHEVISTIMLNWIAIWVGSYLLGEGGPLQNSTQKFLPVTNNVVATAQLPIFWGPKLLQGLSIGIFIALGMLVVYAILVNRSTYGFEVRAVGFNPEAARYSGISVARIYVTTMAIAGGFAGLAGAIDILGWRYNLGPLDIQSQAAQIGALGIATALLGRNTACGVGVASLFFGALLTGASSRQLDPTIFRPELAGDLTTIILGLIVLFVGLNLRAITGWWRAAFARARKDHRVHQPKSCRRASVIAGRETLVAILFTRLTFAPPIARSGTCTLGDFVTT